MTKNKKARTLRQDLTNEAYKKRSYKGLVVIHNEKICTNSTTDLPKPQLREYVINKKLSDGTISITCEGLIGRLNLYDHLNDKRAQSQPKLIKKQIPDFAMPAFHSREHANQHTLRKRFSS